MNEEKGTGKDSPRDPSDNRRMVAVPIEYLPLCNPEEDEIDLRELLAILGKRKWLILAVTCVVIASASVYAFMLAKPLYEARATVEIGHYISSDKETSRSTSVFFGRCANIKKYLDIKYDTAGKYRAPNLGAYLSKVTLAKKGQPFFTLVALGRSNPLATKALQQPLTDILSKHKTFYLSILQNKNTIIKKLTSTPELHEVHVDAL